MKFFKWSIYSVSAVVAAGVLVMLPGSAGSANAPGETQPTEAKQTYTVSAGAKSPDLGDRENYEVEVIPKPTPTPTPEPAVETPAAEEKVWTPPHVTPDPGTAQATAHEMVIAKGWSEDDFACLVSLWNRESGWRVNAHNTSSGAYGIPQSLPGNKMASAGADWETNPATQITWGLNYIGGRYGNPCGAWAHSENNGWY